MVEGRAALPYGSKPGGASAWTTQHRAAAATTRPASPINASSAAASAAASAITSASADADGDGCTGDYLERAEGARFDTAPEAVEVLKRYVDEMHGRSALAELQLSLASSCQSVQTRCATLLLYNLHAALSTRAHFLERFVAESGVVHLTSFLRLCEGSYLQAEVLKVLKQVASTPLGAAAAATADNMAALTAALYRPPDTSTNYWLKRACYAVETLFWFAHNGHAARVARALQAAPPACPDTAPVAALAGLLAAAGTAHVSLLRTVLLLVVELCAQAVPTWRELAAGFADAAAAAAASSGGVGGGTRGGRLVPASLADATIQALAAITQRVARDALKGSVEDLAQAAGGGRAGGGSSVGGSNAACAVAAQVVELAGLVERLRRLHELQQDTPDGFVAGSGSGGNVRPGAWAAAAGGGSGVSANGAEKAVHDMFVVDYPDAQRALRLLVSGVVRGVEGLSQECAAAVEGLARHNVRRDELLCRRTIELRCLRSKVRSSECELPRNLHVAPDYLHDFVTIGEGSFGKVRRAKYRATMEYVAVKELKTIRNEPEVRRLQRKHAFIKETLDLHRLRHNSIVNFYGWLKTEDTVWMMTEYCSGGTLTTLTHNRLLEPADRARIALDVGVCIGPALAYLHSRTPRLVHLDVAARNVLVCGSGGGGAGGPYKLGDVGSLRAEGALDPVICVPWAPPEALSFDGAYAARPSYDVWSFAALLWEVLEGGTPHAELVAEATPEAPFAALVRDETLGGATPPPPFPVAGDELAQGLWDRVIAPAWVAEESRRPVVVLLRELQTLAEEAPPRSSPATPPQPQHQLQQEAAVASAYFGAEQEVGGGGAGGGGVGGVTGGSDQFLPSPESWRSYHPYVNLARRSEVGSVGYRYDA